MTNTPDSLGIIAGSRTLPLILAQSARAAGIRRLVAVGFDRETDPVLEKIVDEMIWIKVGQLVKLINAFRTRSISQCVMAGQISPKRLFDVRPDLRALGMLLRLRERNARTIFAAIADELRRDGIELVEATPWLRAIMPTSGYIVGPKISSSQKKDAIFGRGIAKEVSRFEIGQTVVVKNGTVLAVEAFEGTDACLQRGGELSGPKGGAIAVKVASDHHDFRFDIPCLGPRTIEICSAVKIGLLAFESGKTLLLEQEKMEGLAQRQKVTLLALGSDEIRAA